MQNRTYPFDLWRVGPLCWPVQRRLDAEHADQQISAGPMTCVTAAAVTASIGSSATPSVPADPTNHPTVRTRSLCSATSAGWNAYASEAEGNLHRWPAGLGGT